MDHLQITTPTCEAQLFCNIVTNVTQDITGKEFPLVGIKEGQTVVDYDLIYFREGMLFMGAKHVDGRGFDKPEHRPTNLQIPLVRKN